MSCWLLPPRFSRVTVNQAATEQHCKSGIHVELFARSAPLRPPPAMPSRPVALLTASGARLSM